MSEAVCKLIWCFFIYSFLGWCMEIAYAALKKKHFYNRGVLNGPLCPVYGIGMILILTFFGNLRENLIFLAIGSAVIATLLEFFTGSLMEKLFKKRWWDYSDYKYNLGGYVCIPFSALWGVGAALTVRFIHPLFLLVMGKIPDLAEQIILIAALVILAVDVISVLGIIFQVQKYNQRVEELADGMQQISNRLARAIFTRIERRMVKAHPGVSTDVIRNTECGKNTGVTAKDVDSHRNGLYSETSPIIFAKGCSFHKLVWLFMIGAFLGDITETIFCYATSGVLMSRSSVVFGPFSVVWGLGVVVLTIMLHKYKDRDDRYIFLFGTVVGGAYEYICSVFTEIAFGTVFWDYSKLPFNLGGRINLLYCFFWGLAAVIWIKILYPRISALIEKIPVKAGNCLSWCIIAFMVVNIVISSIALARYSDRQTGKGAANSIDYFLDDHFPDKKMEWIYPNVIIKNEAE